VTFLDPAANPVGLADPGGLSGADQGIPPITPNLPNAVSAFQRRYTPQDVSAMRQYFHPDVVNSFIQFEAKRAQSGQYPLSAEAAIKALQTAQSHKAATAPPSPDPTDVLGNIASDVGNLVTSIPKMPAQIAQDIVHAPQTFQALSSGDPNKILTAPLVRLIPGTYTAHNLLTGNFNEALSHPVQTALDVLPYADKIGLGEKVGSIPAGGGATVADRLGRVTDYMGRTTLGQFTREAWGPQTRSLSRILAEQPDLIAQAGNPAMSGVYTDALSKLRQDNARVAMQIDKAIPDPARQADIVQGFQTGTLDQMNLSDSELAAVNQARNAFHAIEQYGLDAGQLTQRTMQGQTETLLPKDAARLDKVQGRADRTEVLTGLKDAIVNPEAADHATLYDQVNTQLGRNDLTMKQKRTIASGYVHALDAAGMDTGPMLSDIARARSDTLNQIVQPPENLQQLEEGTTRVRRKTGVTSIDSPTRWLEDNRQYTPKKLAAEQARAEAAGAKIVPARWQPMFQQMKMDRVQGYIEQKFAPDDPQLPGLLDAVHQHLYADVPQDILKQIDNEILTEIPKLREAGVNPEYFHNVSPQQAKMMSSPSITTIIPKVSQYSARINDWTPTVDSLSVSINHAGLELARQAGSMSAVGQIRDTFARPYSDVIAELRPTAERVAARTGRDVGTELERLATKEYVRWNETENGFVAGRAGKFKFTEGQYQPDELLIARPLANALERLAQPPKYSRIFDPIQKVFRTSLLPFSPRFYLHHIGGGLLTSTLEDPMVLPYLKRGMDVSTDLRAMQTALRDGREAELPDATAAVLASMPESMRAQFGSAGYAYSPEGDFNIKAGGKLGQLAQMAGVKRMGDAVEWSYRNIDTMDSMYRAAAYLSGHDRGLAAGLTEAEAAQRGMALVNKIMPRWLEMTPLERSALRVVFPFYAYMSHIFRFAARFPIDHPWRTAVMMNIARAEMNDLGTGLPQSLAGAFLLGGPDGNGNQKVIDPNLINPFRDFGSNLTIAGFLGQTNPVFKNALRAMGYDPISRGPNLYPDVTYDPRTGKLVAKTPTLPGLVGQTVADIVPESQLLTALTGTSGNFRKLLSQNPAAAQRLLLSSTGIPILYKSENIPQLAFKAEVTRQNQAKAVLSAAMKSGNYAEAMRWPSLVPMVQQLQTLQKQNALQPFTPDVGSKALTQAEMKAS
jgi:hypothetical protein